MSRAKFLAHPLVIGELACGNLSDRQTVLRLLRSLPEAIAATHDEVLAIIEQHALYGKGLGLIDVHLLAASLLSHATLWTRDKTLAKAAATLGVALPD